MENNLDKYFADYEDPEIHELMLKDRPRQEAYYKAITSNSEFFKNKVVLDVGAGTGILSAFCAKAGARLVYAVEASNLAGVALNVIEENKLTSVVKVIKSRIEDFCLPQGVEKVDIIISEWMGFYLLHEGMLDSVLFARDNFLKPGGSIFPSEATIYVAPTSVSSRFDYWNEVDGIKMRTFGSVLREQKSNKPEIMCIDEHELLHDGVAMHWMNLEEITLQELNEISYKDVVPTKRAGKHQGFCIWFECRFPCDNYEDAVVLSTSPKAAPTHWKQCIVVLPEGACEDLEENSPIAFQIQMKRNSVNKRKYDLVVELLDPNKEEHTIPCDCHFTKCILSKAHLQSMDTT